MLELPVKIGADFNRAIVNGGEQISRLYACLSTWSALHDSYRNQPGQDSAWSLGPDNSVVGLLIVSLLLEIEDCKKHNRDRGYSQQCCNHAVI